jgi:hypothetical protein
LDTVGFAPTSLVTIKIFANETSIHTSEWRACLLVGSFTGAGALRLENEGLCILCIFSQKEYKKKTSNRKKGIRKSGLLK